MHRAVHMTYVLYKGYISSGCQAVDFSVYSDSQLSCTLGACVQEVTPT